VRKKIGAQIFDSPPDFSSIATGLSKSMGIGGIGEKAVELAALTYLKATENTVGVQHRAASEAFHNNDVPAPSLWFYSKADPVSRWDDCTVVTGKWKDKGIEVENCTWEHTPHIQHGRIDPEKYFGTLDRFLTKHHF
jgi:hypothetical protein